MLKIILHALLAATLCLAAFLAVVLLVDGRPLLRRSPAGHGRSGGSPR